MDEGLNSSEKVKKLCSKIIYNFKNNLLSIIVYGSNAKNSKEKSDIDLIVILKRKINSSDDIESLRDIVTPEKESIDIQLFYEKELIKGDIFSLDTHGPFIIEELKNAIPLYGDNPFVNLEVSSDVCRASVIQKLQYYVFRARQSSLGYTIFTKDKNPDFHRKKLKMAMLDMLIAKQVKLKKREEIVKIFVKNYPGIITKEFLSLLLKRSPLNPKEALPIYEALYDGALTLGQKIYPEKIKPKIAKEKEIFFEYVLPNKKENIKFIILCEGLPTVPYQRNLMNILRSQGYGVIYPRYRGTWESEGTFLSEKPSGDISYLAKKFREGIILDNSKLVASEIVLIGSSFGGSVVLSLSDDKNIDKIIALSPVLNFRNYAGANSLKKFLQKTYSQAYRFTEESWKNLLSGEAVPSSLSVNNFSPNKIFVFGGKQDKEISAEELKSWGKQKNIKTIIYENLGHISFSKLEGEILEDILKTLDLSV